MKRALALVALTLVVGAGAAALAAWSVYTRTREPFQGYADTERFVDIPPGAGPAGIGQRLVDAGVVRDTLTFRAAVWLSGRSRQLKAGEYRFDRPQSAAEVVDRIARGDVYKRLLTFREGLTIAEMAAVFESRAFGSAEAFEEAAADGTLIHDLDPDAKDLEGYLFPETYALPRGTPATDVVSQMVAGFKRVFDLDMRAAAAAQGLTVRQAVTLASLVEKETATPGERPLVAAVYTNRLKIGMGMQADPTVIFALQRAGEYDGNLSRSDLQFDSPYNTYRYRGLPPGPIAAPGAASLRAAVRPAEVNYLYFVSRNDGTHVFSATLAEHNRNVRLWQVEYFRRQRQGRGPR